jgi:CRISPR-associated exonuclease Cas4
MSAKPNNKKQSFTSFIVSNFLKTVKQESIDSLGDRSTYIGASDVGSCPHKVINDKLNKPEHSLEKEIVFQRGHIAEEIVAKMLHGIPGLERQFEVKGELDEFPLLAHLDFLVNGKNRKVIVEAKTVSSPIDEPYESWVLQTQFQMGMLMNEIQNEDCQIEAYVVAINVNSGWMKVFKQDFSDDLFLTALNKASHLIDCLKNGEKPKAVIQNYCSGCDYVMECPKQGCFASEMPEDLKEKMRKIIAHKKEAKLIKEMEDELKEYMINTGLEKGKIEDEDFGVVASCKPTQSNRFDKNAFEQDYPELAKKYIKTIDSFRMTLTSAA